jgi:hypothetical protein
MRRGNYRNHWNDGDYEYTGHGTDDGYDAMKDANAEMGLAHDDPRGVGQAIKNGWLRKVPKERPEGN